MANDKDAKKPAAVLRIIAKREGFRRAGIQFGAQPKDVALDTLTKEQIEALKSDPMLVVVETEAKADA